MRAYYSRGWAGRDAPPCVPPNSPEQGPISIHWPVSTGYVGAGAPHPAAGRLCPLHPVSRYPAPCLRTMWALAPHTPPQGGFAPCTSFRGTLARVYGLCGRWRPTPRRRAALPPAPRFAVPCPMSTDYVGAGAPHPAAGRLCPLHPHWGPFHFPQTPLKFRSFSVPSFVLSCLNLAPAVQLYLPIGCRSSQHNANWA
jgi:hypothetical protein